MYQPLLLMLHSIGHAEHIGLQLEVSILGDANRSSLSNTLIVAQHVSASHRLGMHARTYASDGTEVNTRAAFTMVDGV
jgi:hypothetical protein